MAIVNGEHHKESLSEKGDRNGNDDSVEVEFKMWESCKIEGKDLSPERETTHEEYFEDEVDSKLESGEGYNQANGTENGATSPSKDQQQVKKKKPFIRKFGSLLKKKGSSNNSSQK